MAASGGKCNSNGNGLLLYHYYGSYYSQKVVMSLLEKNLKFKSHTVQLLRFEQYEPWFMKLNPKGQVPVLKDGVKVIPDSTRIIDYLEDNFSNGDTPRLWLEKGSEQVAKMHHFRDVLSNVPIEMITIGCLKFKELTKDMKVTLFMRKAFLNSTTRCLEVLDNLARKHPEFAEHYLRKRNRIWQRSPENLKSDDVRSKLDDLEATFDEIEEELGSHVEDLSDWWLCGDRFTVADISLTVLLNWLSYLGLDHRYWGEERRPNLAAYFRRVQARNSFVKTFTQVPRFVQILASLDALKEKAPLIISTSVFLAAVCVGLYVYKCRN